MLLSTYLPQFAYTSQKNLHGSDNDDEWNLAEAACKCQSRLLRHTNTHLLSLHLTRLFPLSLNLNGFLLWHLHIDDRTFTCACTCTCYTYLLTSPSSIPFAISRHESHVAKNFSGHVPGPRDWALGVGATAIMVHSSPYLFSHIDPNPCSNPSWTSFTSSTICWQACRVCTFGRPFQ